MSVTYTKSIARTGPAQYESAVAGSAQTRKGAERPSSSDYGKYTRDSNQIDEETLEQQGRDGQTVANNLDPARNPVNPQLLSEAEFLTNSLCYGLGIPTGAASSWDRRVGEAALAFHKALLARYGDTARDFAVANRKQQRQQFGAEIAEAVGTGASGILNKPIRSVNNEMSARGVKKESDEASTKDTSGTDADGAHRFDEGRQRGQDPAEPAHHFGKHEPTLWDRVHGGVKVAAGTVRMDQDIKTQGKAELKGQTRDHY